MWFNEFLEACDETLMGILFDMLVSLKSALPFVDSIVMKLTSYEAGYSNVFWVISISGSNFFTHFPTRCEQIPFDLTYTTYSHFLFCSVFLLMFLNMFL